MNNVLIFCIIGVVILCVIIIIAKSSGANNAKKAKLNAENSEEARKQREQWASDVKQKALSISNRCGSNEKNAGKLVQADYRSASQMELILKELSNAAELKGKLDAMAEDTKKGGVSE